MKAAIETLGCRVNTYDSEAMAELFRRDGYSLVPFTEKADVYVVNTCTVTKMAERRSRQYIRRARRLNPEAVICVVGCYPQVAAEDVASLEEVDVILGSRNKSRVVEFANRSLATGERLVEVSAVLASHAFEPLVVSEYQNLTRAFLKIQDGCNRFCTYCVIPYTRGGISSKDKEQVLAEIRTLAARGFQEVILSGIHIASYGLDLPPMGEGLFLGPQQKPFGLVDLLEEVEAIPGLERVRIGSIEPLFFQGAALERLSRLRKLCPHFHLSLQSGSDAVLKRMNRRYSSAEFAEVVERLRLVLPGVSLTTDLITGFPGETEEEHGETMAFLSRLRLTKTHIFRYSPRPGTPAAAMPFQVDFATKERRARELADLSDVHELAFHEAMLGQTHQVLFESQAEDLLKGYAGNYVEVRAKGAEELLGKILPVTISQALGDHCIGEVVG